MPLNIKNEEAHLLAKELAELTGESLTEAVTGALREALEGRRSRRAERTRSLIGELTEIAEFTANLPVLDLRSADEILGYNDRGVPE